MKWEEYFQIEKSSGLLFGGCDSRGNGTTWQAVDGEKRVVCSGSGWSSLAKAWDVREGTIKFNKLQKMIES